MAGARGPKNALKKSAIFIKQDQKANQYVLTNMNDFIRAHTYAVENKNEDSQKELE